MSSRNWRAKYRDRTESKASRARGRRRLLDGDRNAERNRVAERGAIDWELCAATYADERLHGIDPVDNINDNVHAFVIEWAEWIAFLEGVCDHPQTSVPTKAGTPFWASTADDAFNKRVIAAFQVADGQALAFFRAGPLIRVDLWRGEFRPLAHADRCAALQLDELTTFAHERFNLDPIPDHPRPCIRVA